MELKQGKLLKLKFRNSTLIIKPRQVKVVWQKLIFLLIFNSGRLKIRNFIKVIIESETDSVADQIGFRSIEVKGSKVLLNKKPIFLKAVNIHEENPYKAARAYSEDDAEILLNAAKELGCNLVRLAHYPHTENMVKEAEKMGIMVWDELPIYQHIKFSDSLVPKKMETMMQRNDKQG